MYLLSPPTSFEKIVSKLVRVRGRGLSVVQNLINKFFISDLLF